MYFNDVHILYYVLFGVIAAVLGQGIDYISKAFIKEKKIFSKETLSEYKGATPNYTLIFFMAMSYIALLYKFGIYSDMVKNIDLIKYLLLIPMLLCAFFVDLKEQIIPNRLNLLMFEIGLVLVVLNGFSNINIAIDMLFGMVVRRRNIYNYSINRKFYCRKRSNGTWRCEVDGCLRIIFWAKYYHCNFCNVILTRSNNKCAFNGG